MSTQYLQPILDEVSIEGDNGRHKFGDQFHLTDPEWLAVLAEEFGEVAMIVTKTSVPPITNPEINIHNDLVGELLQVAAVSARWIAAIQERRFKSNG